MDYKNLNFLILLKITYIKIMNTNNILVENNHLVKINNKKNCIKKFKLKIFQILEI